MPKPHDYSRQMCQVCAANARVVPTWVLPRPVVCTGTLFDGWGHLPGSASAKGNEEASPACAPLATPQSLAQTAKADHASSSPAYFGARAES
jgi:hypothetical protein